ncbi:MAG: histidine triad family protein [Miltoncostaeaceae bacterium]|nr:histidine triad family protein [Miltoncostaeaceae bacterium]
MGTVEDCIFCRIVRGEIDARVAHRADGMLAFHDVAPKAPVHLLVIPERHVPSIAEVDALSLEERGRMLSFIAQTASRAGLDEAGYRVTTNHGKDGRQSVHHLHWHVMGGIRLSDTM